MSAKYRPLESNKKISEQEKTLFLFSPPIKNAFFTPKRELKSFFHSKKHDSRPCTTLESYRDGVKPFSAKKIRVNSMIPKPTESSNENQIPFLYLNSKGKTTINFENQENLINKIYKKSKEFYFLKEKIKFIKFKEKEDNIVNGLLEICIEKCLDKFKLLPNIEYEICNIVLEIGISVLNKYKKDYENNLLKQKEIDEFKKEIKILQNNIENNSLQKIDVTLNKILNSNDININNKNIEILENVKLEKEIETLKINVANTNKLQENSKQFENHKTILIHTLQEKDSILKSKDLTLQKFSYHLNLLKSSLFKSEKDCKELTNELKIYKNKNLDLLESLKEEKNTSKRYFETSLMQKEECDLLYDQIQKLLKTLSLLNTKLTESHKKFVQQVDYLGLKSDEDFENETLLIRDVGEVLQMNYAKSMNQTNFPQKDFNLTNENLLNQVSLNQFQYYRPSYRVFIENEKKSQNMEKYQISQVFIATIRGIFDCKYNELITNDDLRFFSKFPEFVYSWIGNFQIDPESRLVRTIDSSQINDPNKLFNNFIFNLYHPMSTKIWEVQNFKEFIEEKGSSDELFFFLHCRFLLNRGLALENDGGSYIYVQFVLFSFVELLIDIIFESFDSETKIFLKNKLREKAKVKNKKLFVDIGLVLRIFLEYYKIERKQRFINIRELFRVFQINNPRKKMNFNDFKTILQKTIPKISELEKAELYRECMQIGKNDINAEIFYTVLTENNVFLKSLKLKSFMTSNKQTLYKHFFIPVNDDYVANMNRIFKKLQGSGELIQVIQNYIKEIGIEKIDINYENEIKLFSDRLKFVDLSEFSYKNPESAIINIIFILLKIFNYQQMKDHLRNIEYGDGDNINKLWDILKIVGQMLEDKKKKDKIKEFEINLKIKKIQGFFKKKVNKWYGLIKGLLTRIKEKEKEK